MSRQVVMALRDSLWLLHCIAPENFAALQKSKVLKSASSLMNAAERKCYETQKRDECVKLSNGIVLRDQQPLTDKIKFSDDTTFPQYVKYINEHVFFWPTKIPNMFCNKYSHHIILRCKLSDLEDENPDTEILFSRYNSGATPRIPTQSPRLLNLFQPLKSRVGTALVEVVAYRNIRLPANTEYKNANGEWCAFFNQVSSAVKKSRLAPTRFPDLGEISGVKFAAIAAGIKHQDRNDLMLASFCPGTAVAGVFTQSSTASAPVVLCRDHLASGAAAALIVNAGNANAFTGKIGEQHCQATCRAVAKAINCDADKIFVASTGVIGAPLPIDRIVNAIPRLADKLHPNHWRDAAQAITTTDTFAKGATVRTAIADAPVTINGFAKGSGMIEPDMATMLAFIFTDAAIPRAALQSLLVAANERSFNCITVDSDTSTSDTCLLFATGQAGNPPLCDADDAALDDFKRALAQVMTDLALQIVRDGEGATKLIEITVSGAASDRAAAVIAKSIANSPLVKTAIAGEDANWGRIVMAVGKSGEQADRDNLKINIGGVLITEHGQVAESYDEADDEAGVAKHLQGDEIFIAVDVGIGGGVATVWTCDLTHGYIRINADYRS
ncbi:bifunctional glutamate N-acetyltransferase/amino-acid acetyltransferase ArgJ [Candidatus Spongiihabitans sp.]|uniref:bifunctional glutamate N-acetyltransferase/amino-acid acetyltransferase ArgJ n=1 Tax=Candidatus Spongiihabitans sp. TaxID=3101308 RepID=UPI003C7CBAD9